MTLKIFFLRFLLFALCVVGGMLAYALTFHVLVALGVMPASLNGQGFGLALTYQTSYVVMGATIISFISIFIRANWRYIFLLAPIYAPVVFAVIFTLMHQDASGADVPATAPPLP